MVVEVGMVSYPLAIFYASYRLHVTSRERADGLVLNNPYVGPDEVRNGFVPPSVFDSYYARRRRRIEGYTQFPTSSPDSPYGQL